MYKSQITSPMALAVAALEPSDEPLATEAAQRWNLPLIGRQPDADSEENLSVNFILLVSANRILLQPLTFKSGPIDIDFTRGATLHRLKFGGGRNQPLSRALGLGKPKRANPIPVRHICDATAGFGTDSWVIASLGCKVTAIERSAWLSDMLEVALAAAMLSPDVAQIASKITVRHADAQTCLAGLSAIDVVYLDPMYPVNTKTAAAKKEMQALQALIGPDQDSSKLLLAALHAARYRVVVKRPKRALPLVHPSVLPDTQISSVNTRYDIYSRLHYAQKLAAEDLS